jgi:PPOX class probable FMN-dependent enzyme
MMGKVSSVEDLRGLYPATKERAKLKQLTSLDVHMRAYIALSPFVVLATKGSAGMADATPRGGEPGWVKVENDGAILLPDWPGNNRLDSLQNILDSPGVGLLFLVPGVDETLRINGDAEIVVDDAIRQLFETRGKLPRTVLRVKIREAYLHCAKALMRSRLWDDESKIERSRLPTMGRMIGDQTGKPDAPESQAEMERRYQSELYAADSATANSNA